ncbi:MAG: hypothetical protein HYY01_09760 [Chloroflexi bacterium]|nr:hypothetical protein [Chloroflexota bacterium]
MPPLEQLHREFGPQGVRFFTVYTREPHPAENYPHHTSYEQKLRHAAHCRQQDGITMPIIVDSLDGEIHRAYGTLPNMVYIIDRRGRIFFRSQWTQHREIREALEELILIEQARARGERLRPVYSERLGLREDYPDAHQRVFRRAGPQATADFERQSGKAPVPGN